MARYYKLDIPDWNEGTDDLPLELEAAYLRIVNHIRLHEKPLRDNWRVLAGIWRTPHPKTVARIKRQLVEAGKIVVRDGRVWNPRALREAEAMGRYAAKQAERGSKGGKARAAAMAERDGQPLEEELDLIPADIDEEEIGEAETAASPAPDPDPDPEPEKAADDTTERERLLEIMGHDKSGMLPSGKQVGGRSDMMQYQRWREELGLDVDEIADVVREVVAGKRDGPPTSFRYFTSAMARFAADKAEAATPININEHRDKGGASGNRTRKAPHRDADARSRQALVAAGFARSPSGDNF